MKFALAIIVSACASLITPALARLGEPRDQDEIVPVEPNPPNPASDACASVAAFIIAPQVFQAGDEKDLPQWIQTCNAHPDPSMCKETIQIIIENQKDLPPGLKCE